MLLQLAIIALVFQLVYYKPFGMWLFSSISDTTKRANIIVIFQRLAIATLFLAGRGSRSMAFSGPLSDVQHNIITLAICLLVVALNFGYISKSRDAGKRLQLKYAAHSGIHFFINTVTWAVYLAAYEYYLRGVLLEQLIAAYSIPLAIMFNVFFYAFLHLQKSWGELIGSIPFGLLLCWITLYTGSIIPAIAIHITFALSHDYLAIYFQRKLAPIREKERARQ